MTMHSSLSQKSKGRHRSVLKRFERVGLLKKEGKWDSQASAFGLPKVKIIKIRAKKEKAPAAAEGTAAPDAQTPSKKEEKK